MQKAKGFDVSAQPDGKRDVARLVVMISGSGSNLQAMIDAIRSGELGAEIVGVISNRGDAFGLERAAAAGIPTQVHGLKGYRAAGHSRAEYDADLAELVAGYGPDWVVLAGWMLILSDAFIQRFPNRIVNLHPALPGQFPGTHAIERAYAAFQRGEIAHTGIMVHLVPDERVDEGPVLATTQVPILAGETVEELAQRVHAAEHKLLVETLGRLTNTKNGPIA